MMLRVLSFFWAATLIPLGFAQSTSSSVTSASSTSSSAAPTHTVAVGANGLVFSPNQLTAAVGDVVEFLFYPQNHSVARSEYKSPCIPYEDTGVGRSGFWSGFHPVAVVLPDPPKFQVKINDTEPIFFYCSAPGACIDDGMIGVINANATETFDTQLAYAKNATLMFSPGQYAPSEIVPTTSSTTSSPTAVAPTDTPASSNHSLSAGAIAGIAIGGAIVLLLGAALVYLCGRQRTMGELRYSQSPSGPPSYAPPHLSMSSSAPIFPPKLPQFDFDEVTPGRYSGHGYDRSVDATESYRSQSPAFEETRENDMMIPSIYVAGLPGNMSSEGRQSPMRRPVPESPLRPSPISPLGETMYVPLRMETNIAPPPANLRYDPQGGLHELGVEGESTYRGYNHDNHPTI